jgi:hypothetical protein
MDANVSGPLDALINAINPDARQTLRVMKGASPSVQHLVLGTIPVAQREQLRLLGVCRMQTDRDGYETPVLTALGAAVIEELRALTAAEQEEIAVRFDALRQQWREQHRIALKRTFSGAWITPERWSDAWIVAAHSERSGVSPVRLDLEGAQRRGVMKRDHPLDAELKVDFAVRRFGRATRTGWITVRGDGVGNSTVEIGLDQGSRVQKLLVGDEQAIRSVADALSGALDDRSPHRFCPADLQ